MNNERVIALGIFRINPFKASRVDNFVSNKHVKSSVKTKPITASQPHVITKKDVNSITNGFSPKNVEITTRTRISQPRNNPKSDKVTSNSKSSFLSSKLEKIKENYRSLQSSNYPDHTSSECNIVKIVIQNEKSEVICATCKKCLITANHDECVLQYVNGIKSRKKNQSTNVSKSSNQKKHKANVKKSKNSGSKESLASPSKPRSFLRWLPTGRIFDLYGKITSSSNTKSEPDTSVCDNASASNPQEPTNKRFPTSTSFLGRYDSHDVNDRVGKSIWSFVRRIIGSCDSDLEVRIRQKSQENRQKRANTDTRTEECARAESQSQKSQPSKKSKVTNLVPQVS
ncbi:hypothetical protein Tco_0421042 [Tanacetum coccineum]